MRIHGRRKKINTPYLAWNTSFLSFDTRYTQQQLINNTYEESPTQNANLAVCKEIKLFSLKSILGWKKKKYFL
jgi:hypothetical protein